MIFEIKNRWTGEVQIKAEIGCEKGFSLSWKLRLAILWAIRNSANLRDANLRDANLYAADLTDADLRRFKSCLWMTLTTYKSEVPALIESLKAGRIDGSKYSGECACLMGTIANAKSVHVDTLPKNSRDASERWFLMIKKGDKPGDATGGGYAAKMALEWVEEWQGFQE